MPEALPAVRTLVLMAFRQTQQGCVDRWIARAEEAGIPGSPADLRPGDETCVIEVPAISTRWSLGQRFIDGGMASSIRVPRVLARTITVYTDVDTLRRALGIPGPDAVQALVVTPAGKVLARVGGEPVPAAWAVIERALRSDPSA